MKGNLVGLEGKAPGCFLPLFESLGQKFLLKVGYPIIFVSNVFPSFSQLPFDSQMYTKPATAADFVYISELNESWETYSTQRR